MKTTKPLIIVYVLLASFLVAGIALTNDPGIFDSVSPDNHISPER